MNKRRLQRSAVLIGILLLVLAGGSFVWLRAQKRQYALNRQLIAALVKNDTNAAIALVNAGADPDTPYAPTPVPSLFDLMKCFLHRSVPPPNNTLTAFLIACGAHGKDDYATFEAEFDRPDAPKLVQAMLRHGAMVNAPDEHKWTPLLWAIRYNRRKTVGVLLQHGADANAKYGRTGQTPLMLAAAYDAAPDVVRLLLEHKADVNATAKSGWTPLISFVGYHAASNIVYLLLEHGAKVNAQGRDGRSALYVAIGSGEDKDVIRQLLSHGANPNLPTKGGDTALNLAQGYKRRDIVALLRQAGARK